MNLKLIIIIAFAAVIVILFLVYLFVSRYQKNAMLKKVDTLNILRNEIVSIPFNNQISKVANLTKGEQLEEKITNYQNIYNDLISESIKEIDDKLVELDFTASNKKAKEFNQKYLSI